MLVGSPFKFKQNVRYVCAFRLGWVTVKVLSVIIKGQNQAGILSSNEPKLGYFTMMSQPTRLIENYQV